MTFSVVFERVQSNRTLAPAVMQTAQAHVDFTQCVRSDSGLVIAGLSVRTNELAFPHPEWTDFIVVVLHWWTVALTALLRDNTKSVEARFMDGPFLMEIQSAVGGTWRVQFIEAGLKRRLRAEAVVEVAPLVKSVLVASDRTLELCRDRNWWSSDAETLEAAVTNLRNEARLLVNQPSS